MTPGERETCDSSSSPLDVAFLTVFEKVPSRDAMVVEVVLLCVTIWTALKALLKKQI